MMEHGSCLQGTTTVGERGQIVIPQNIRTALNIKAGDEMVVLSRDGKVIVLPAQALEKFYNSILSQLDDMRTLKKKSSARKK